jgi:hypothetical protein
VQPGIEVNPIATYTAPDLAHAAVYPSPTGYVVRFGYLSSSGEVFYPSAIKPARPYVSEKAARMAAGAWVS